MRLIFLLLVSFLLLYPVSALANEISCQLNPTELSVGLDPTNQTITVTGHAPANAPVVIKIEGPERPVMVSLCPDNSFIKYHEAEVQGLPGYYQILTTDYIEKFNSQQWPKLELYPDFRQLTNNAWVRMRQNSGESYGNNQQDYINLAIKIKEDKYLLALRQGVIKRSGEKYQANIPLVKGMPLGQIKVTAMTIVNNQVISSPSRSFYLKPASYLTVGSQELSISAVLVILLFMVPIFLLIVAHILEIIEQKKEEKRRNRLLRQIWQ